MFGTALGDNFEVESTRCGSAHTSTDTGEDDLVNVGNFDEKRGFGDEEDVLFEEE